eukprot:CAMPEP_0119388568 /NCGR_PEP_ID=MMETSP1334-20130426/105533_1 /TAXON_ID=127549 /ORGANISM="Calcidiscus leptoporus, Strain RCC1130" /LENGTH=77 /DNA_ID=CAMNT_0007410595 /DNA_START=636 /DNA_END=867 /DNA_ORIENTATION=+
MSIPNLGEFLRIDIARGRRRTGERYSCVSFCAKPSDAVTAGFGSPPSDSAGARRGLPAVDKLPEAAGRAAPVSAAPV